jgi:hypothetical protein
MTCSSKITVVPKTVVVLTLSGLADSDVQVLEYLADHADCVGQEQFDVWVPFSPGGCQWAMSAKHNPLMLDTPGTYRLCAFGAPQPNVKLTIDTYTV